LINGGTGEHDVGVSEIRPASPSASQVFPDLPPVPNLLLQRSMRIQHPRSAVIYRKKQDAAAECEPGLPLHGVPETSGPEPVQARHGAVGALAKR
jgi:hypothetical protein